MSIKMIGGKWHRRYKIEAPEASSLLNRVRHKWAESIEDAFENSCILFYTGHTLNIHITAPSGEKYHKRFAQYEGRWTTIKDTRLVYNGP